MIACKCGGEFVAISGLEGLLCNKCGKSISGDVDSLGTVSEAGYDPATAYADERLKSIRGVSMSSLVIGTPSKGCLTVQFPPYLSATEQKALVDSELAVLKYAKEQVTALGLDIYSKAKKEGSE